MIIEIIQQTLMITSFVMIMMLVIEYVNVRSQGAWSHALKKNIFLQLLFASLIGMIPGCLGTFATVSLYTHNIIGFAALTASFISTTGDEAFLMYALIPKAALVLNIVLLLLAMSIGAMVHFLWKNKTSMITDTLELHHDIDEWHGKPFEAISHNIKNISFPRAILISGLFLFIFLLLSGGLGYGHSHEDGHHHEEEIKWIIITFFILALFALYIVVRVPDHFLEEHLWGHIIKKHFIRIFLWVIGTLFVLHLITDRININDWIENNYIGVALIAIAIGLIPESGPHIIFTTLFLSGQIPFSILLINSLVQDGHGGLPLMAESKKAFIIIKIIKVIIALLIMIGAYYLQ